MFSKRNIKLREEKNRDEKQRFSIRKLTIGATSVLVGVSFFMYGAQSASAATTDDAPVVEKSATEPSNEDGNKVVESNNDNDSKNNTEINTENSNGSGDAQRDVTLSAQSEKTEKKDSSLETGSKAASQNVIGSQDKHKQTSPSDEKQAATTETAKTEEAA
ncbi:YSIRK-type signal peptide-containing protein, partial [Lactobacillus intestinalis]|uniref:YSIRK-type signal peptide-containing protein n=1 Tax=Lactobacillus intestinalis TaxID=151781 RepID=UPI0026F359F3